MQHWTKAQLNERYEALREQWHALMRARPQEPVRQIEMYRSLAAIELCFADVVEAALNRTDTFLEFQALGQAARYRRGEAEHWRSQAAEIAARAGGA